MNATWIAFLAIAAASPVLAQEAPEPRFVAITIENDFFAGYDRHYTSGFQFAFLVDTKELPAFARDLPPFGWSRDPKVVVAIGQRIYTPSDTAAHTPDPRDRPYAGWIYAMADVQTKSGVVVDHVTVSLGMVGPASFAHQTQNTVHRSLQRERSNGWGAQLDNEPTLLAGFERAWRSALVGDDSSGRRFDLTPRVGAAIGNVLTYASAGFVLRYGSELPRDLPVTHISLGPSRDGYRGTTRFGWYGWLGMDARAVARNIFLDGNTLHDGPHVERRPYGNDLQAGLALAWQTARVGFTFVRRSREFNAQDKPDRFGQLSLSFAY